MEALQVLVARSIEDPCEWFRPLSHALAALTALHQAAKFEQLRAEDCALSHWLLHHWLQVLVASPARVPH